MAAEEEKDSGSALMKIVQAITISPDDAREIVRQYEAQARAKHPTADDDAIKKIVIAKIIQRYSSLAGVSGGVSSLAGVVPGFGSAIAAYGGGFADASICVKLQADMTMCIAIAINDRLTNEDARHMTFVIALGGLLENFATGKVSKTVSKAAVKVVREHLKAATLQTVKQLFRAVGIAFSRKAVEKAIPYGIGVVIGTTANYYLTRYVGKLARDVLLLEAGGESQGNRQVAKA
jgi:hypothetical protein